MNWLRAFCIAGFSLCLLSCAEHAPDPTRVVVAVRKVKQSQERARSAHKEERAKVKEAQAAADALSVVSAELLGKVDSLAKILPPQFQSPLADIRKDAVEAQAKEDFLMAGLVSVWQKDNEVEQHLAATDSNLANLEVEHANYYREAVKQADKLTAAEKKLWWYRLHWWGAWIALGTGVIGCAVWACLKWGAKWSAKLGKYAAL